MSFLHDQTDSNHDLKTTGDQDISDRPVINCLATMPRPSNPNARIQLLAAAEAVFAARGLDEAKVEEIATRAGLAKGSFYLHFESKEDAFRQLVEMMLARMKAQIEAMAEDAISAKASLAEVLEGWVAADLELFEFIWQNRAVVSLMLDGGRCAAFRHLVDGFCDEAAVKTKRLLLRGIEAGIYRRDLDIDVTAAFIAGAYDRLARQIVREPRRPDLTKLLREVQSLVLRGLASPTTVRELEELSRTGAHAGNGRRAPARAAGRARDLDPKSIDPKLPGPKAPERKTRKRVPDERPRR